MFLVKLSSGSIKRMTQVLMFHYRVLSIQFLA